MKRLCYCIYYLLLLFLPTFYQKTILGHCLKLVDFLTVVVVTIHQPYVSWILWNEAWHKHDVIYNNQVSSKVNNINMFLWLLPSFSIPSPFQVCVLAAAFTGMKWCPQLDFYLAYSTLNMLILVAIVDIQNI